MRRLLYPLAALHAAVFAASLGISLSLPDGGDDGCRWSLVVLPVVLCDGTIADGPAQVFLNLWLWPIYRFLFIGSLDLSAADTIGQAIWRLVGVGLAAAQVALLAIFVVGSIARAATRIRAAIR